MPRSGKVVRERLRQAALELFDEHGFDQITAERIAARAGVTERTFFRHFTDKREVVFEGNAQLHENLTRALAAVPVHLEPLPAIRAAFHELVPAIERNRPTTELGARVIAVTPALRERQLAKWAAIVTLLTDALTARGVDTRTAETGGQVGANICAIALRRWMNDSSAGLDAELDGAFHELHEVADTLGPQH